MIKAKVATKSKIREFNQGKGKGQLFDILLVDSTNEIKCTFFNTAVDKFANAIEVGKVYIFTGGEVRKGSKFNTSSNPNEITFGTKTEIYLCTDDNFKAIKKYKFKKIGDI